jgi:hypothetical protein
LEDVMAIDAIVNKSRFALPEKSERELEFALTQAFTAHSDKLRGKIFSQADQDKILKSVFLLWQAAQARFDDLRGWHCHRNQVLDQECLRGTILKLN